MLQRSHRTAGFIEPCLPSPAKAPPNGLNWVHEIKHDGFRIMGRRDAEGVRLIKRNGHDFRRSRLLVRSPRLALALIAVFSQRMRERD
jgi:ATP-dependent DNA ligase